MALNVNRWVKYAKARIDSAVGSGHEELDRLEAKREAERADKPWLGSDSAAPTFDEARARIAWEADQQAKKADRLHAGEPAKTSWAEGPGTKGAGPVTGTGSEPAEGADDPDAPHRRKTDVGSTKANAPDRPSTLADPPDRSSANTEPAGGDPATAGDDPTAPADQPTDDGPAPRSPQQIAEDAERESARLELEDRQRKSAERLDEIRRELGIDDTPTP